MLRSFQEHLRPLEKAEFMSFYRGRGGGGEGVLYQYLTGMCPQNPFSFKWFRKMYTQFRNFLSFKGFFRPCLQKFPQVGNVAGLKNMILYVIWSINFYCFVEKLIVNMNWFNQKLFLENEIRQRFAKNASWKLN